MGQSVKGALLAARAAIPARFGYVFIGCEWACYNHPPGPRGLWTLAIQPAPDGEPCALYHGTSPRTCLEAALADIVKHAPSDAGPCEDGDGEDATQAPEVAFFAGPMGRPAVPVKGATTGDEGEAL